MMNDFDIEALAFTEAKVNEVQQALISHLQFVCKKTADVLKMESIKELNDISSAIDRIKPSDRKFTLSQIVEMRKKFKECSEGILVTVSQTEELLYRTADYAATYIAQGVSPKELDISVKGVFASVRPTAHLFVEMVTSISKVHPHAYCVFGSLNESRLQAFVQLRLVVERESHELIGRLNECANVLDSQQTFLMSGDGFEKRQMMLGRLVKFIHSMRQFVST